ncbi:DUF3253 domain-containing protein [Algoriphagus lacus]|uniref:DUF3253 domain-containing protein n=1 Tax=Algoriphagus lacus TaxID=2056311 RepID=A0A418PQ96_9BACT|nr:DUF3253 domain-containing protein [Algoriphagus lacus]RIW14491.1 DUF3253 domain-containing protein [Algoriphagus lacus]
MEVLRTAILDFCRRRKGKAFSPSDVVKQLFPEDWEMFIPEVTEVMMELYREGVIEVTQNGVPIDPQSSPTEYVQIQGISKPK